GIHHDDGVGCRRGLDAGGKRRLLAEIARELQQSDRPPAIVEVIEKGETAVATAVVDEDVAYRQAVIPGDGCGDPVQPRDERGKVVGLIVDGHDDREVPGVHSFPFKKTNIDEAAKLKSETTTMTIASAIGTGRPAIVNTCSAATRSASTSAASSMKRT